MATKTIICEHCGSAVVRHSSPANLNRLKFCSRQCMSQDFKNRTKTFEDAVKSKFATHSRNEPNGCIVYTGQSNGSYGQIEHKRKTYLAHRAAYLVFKGEIPDGKMVCHSCDNRLCINPDHLWLGSAKDNVQDMISKNRQRYVQRLKFSDEQIGEIKKALSDGMSHSKISELFGVSCAYVSLLRNNKRRQQSTDLAELNNLSLSS